jgi:hypothetical protein
MEGFVVKFGIGSSLAMVSLCGSASWLPIAIHGHPGSRFGSGGVFIGCSEHTASPFGTDGGGHRSGFNKGFRGKCD